jgi:hypothetical protein
MSEDWNNEKNIIFTAVTVPSLYIPTSGIKIFLAGSIDQPEQNNWRDQAINHIEHSWFNSPENNSSITVYSPRRAEEWSFELENEQAAWDTSMLAMVDYVVLHLTGETISPVSLLELGIFLTHPKLHLSIDDSYTRKHVVELYYTYYGCNEVYSSWINSISAISEKTTKG